MKNLILKKLHLGKAILFVFMLMSWISFGQEVCNVPDQWDYVTIADGDWDSNSTWENGLIPDDGATKIKDKNILITHHITRTDSNIDTEDVILHIDGGSLVLNRAFNPGRESMIILENAHLEVTNGKKIQLKGQTTLCSINSCIIADSAIDINYGDVHIVNSGLISRNNEIQFSREITVTGSDMRFWADDYIEVSNSNINWDFENTVSAWYSRAKSSWEGSGKPDMNLLPPMEDASYDACEQAFEGDLCVYQDCNDNTYLNSDDPNTIEYDNIIGLYHSTMIKEIDGTVKVWGASSSPTSSAVTSPIAVTPENGYHYDGEILKMAAGAGSGSNVQFAILTTEGLYFWGRAGNLVDSAVKSGNDFEKGNAIGTEGETGTNSYSLPMGVHPEDVKMMFGTHETLTIVTCSGEAYVLSRYRYMYGDGITDSDSSYRSVWHRVSTAPGVPLENVVAVRGSTSALMALTTGGKVYTWGKRTYLGDNSSYSDRTFATQMDLSDLNLFGTKRVKMIGMTGGNSYYILTTNGELWGLGDNSDRELGLFNTTSRYQQWQRVELKSNGEDFDEIAWISPNEHSGNSSSRSAGYGGVNALTSSGKLWAWGRNSNRMLGESSGTIDPTLQPGGLDAEDRLMAVETGGHISMVIKQCSKKYGYVGHKINGSMGDGTSGEGQEDTYNFSATAEITLCGAPTTPSVEKEIYICLPTDKTNLNDVLLNDIPNGYTIEWWTTSTREPGTQITNLLVEGIGTYYAFFIAHEGGCENLDGEKVEILFDDIANCPTIDATPDFNQTPEGKPVNGNVLTNDRGDDIKVTEFVVTDENGNSKIVEVPENGSVTEDVYVIKDNTPVKAGSIEFNSNGNYTFTPEEGFTGTIPLEYAIENDDELRDQTNLTLKVIPVYDPSENNNPIAQDDAYKITENKTLNVNILDNDFHPGNLNLILTSITQGSTTISTSTSTTVSGTDSNGDPVAEAGTITINEDGHLSFTPANGFSGKIDPIKYVIEDEDGMNDEAHIYIRVLPEDGSNHTFAHDDAKSAPMGEIMNGNVLHNDIDPEDDTQSLTSVTIDGTTYTIPQGSSQEINIPEKGSLTMHSNGDYTFIPEEDFIGTVVVEQNVCDNGTPQACDQATLYLTSFEQVEDSNCIEIIGEQIWNERLSQDQANLLPEPIFDAYEPIIIENADGGMFMDIYKLDNSFDLKINGVSIATQELQFDIGTSNAPTFNVRFLDGDLYKYDTPSIWQINGTEANPTIRVEINHNGEVTLYGSKESGGILHELRLYNGAEFNHITWNPEGQNTIEVTQDAYGWTRLNAKVYGISVCEQGMYEITKTADTNLIQDATVGDIITYTIEVTNISNENIPSITVVDHLLGGELENNYQGDLEPGQSWTFTEEYAITAQDIEAGGVYNQATVFGLDTNGNAIPTKKSFDPINGLDENDPNFNEACEDCTFTALEGRESCQTRISLISDDPFYWSFNSGTAPGSVISNQGTVSGTNGGFVFDIYRLNRSFNLKINDTYISEEEIQFWYHTAYTRPNIQFVDGDEYQVEVPKVSSLRGTAENPILRVQIDQEGNVRMFGAKEDEGDLYELTLKNSEFKQVNWHANLENTIEISQNVLLGTTFEGYGYGIHNTCEVLDFVKTGVFNDLNNDGIAQAGETITYTFSVTNNDLVNLKHLKIFDELLGGYLQTDFDQNSILEPNDSWTFEIDYILTEEDIARGGVYNQAELFAQRDDGIAVTSVKSTTEQNNISQDEKRPDHTFVELPYDDEECKTQFEDKYIEYSTHGYYWRDAPKTTQWTFQAGNGGYIIDIYKLNNSFNLNINGQDIHSEEIEFWYHPQYTSINIGFADGDEYQTTDIPKIFDIHGDVDHPVIRIHITPEGKVSLKGSKESYGELYDLKLLNGSNFSDVPWNNNGENTITLNQKLTFGTNIKAQTYIVQNKCREDFTPFANEEPENFEDLNNFRVKLYPNPVEHSLYLESTSNIEEVSVYNILGQKVKSERPNGKQTKIDMESLQPDIYLIRVQSEGKTETYRVVKR